MPYSRCAGFDPTSMQSPSEPRSGTVYFRTLFDRCTSLSGFTRFLEFCILVHLCRIVCIIRCLSEQMCHFPGHAYSLLHRLYHVIAVRCTISFHISSFYSSQLHYVFYVSDPRFRGNLNTYNHVCELFGSNWRLVFLRV